MIPLVRAFADGLFGPSRLAAGVTVAVAAGLLALVPAILTPDLVRAGDERMLMIASWDEYGLLTGRALHLANRERRSDEVVLLGTSVLVEGISHPSDLAADLTAAVGRPIPVHDLSGSGQAPIDQIAALDAIAPTRGIVVVTPAFAADASEYPERVSRPRYGFRSPWLDQTLARLGATPPPTTGVYAVDNLPFFARRLPYLLRNLALGPPAYAGHAHVGKPPFHGDDPARLVAKMVARNDRVDESFDVNAAIFAELVARVRHDGGEVVFLAPTLNPAYREAIDTPELVAYRQRFVALAAEAGARWLDVQPDAALTSDDFNDVLHLDTPDGMRRYTAALARALAPLLAERR